MDSPGPTEELTKTETSTLMSGRSALSVDNTLLVFGDGGGIVAVYSNSCCRRGDIFSFY